MPRHTTSPTSTQYTTTITSSTGTTDTDRDTLNTLLDELLNAANTTHAEQRVTEYLTHSHPDLAITNYTDAQQQHLTEQYCHRTPDWTDGKHWGTNHEWRDHGRTIPDNTDPFTLPTPGTGDTPSTVQEVYAYPQTLPLPDATTSNSPAFEPIAPDVTTTAPHHHATKQLLGALTTAAETGAVQGLEPVTITHGTPADIGLHANGASTANHVTTRNRLTPANEFRTLTHELAHITLHGTTRDIPLPQEEIEAEAVAYLVTATTRSLSPTNSELYIRRFQEYMTPGTDTTDRTTISNRREQVTGTAARIIDAIHHQH